MKNNLKSRGSLFFSIVTTVIVFLFCSTSLFCSKGNNPIEPIRPDPEFSGQFQSSDNPTISLPQRESQEQFQTFSPQLIPIMPVKIVDELNGKLDDVIGKYEKLNDQLIFFEAKPEGQQVKNPPLFSFSFAATKDGITPEEINVKIDKDDISKDVKYYYYFDPTRNAAFYVAYYEANRYFAPRDNHAFKVDFEPSKGGSLNRSVDFSVPQDPELLISDVGFSRQRTDQVFKMNEMIAIIQAPEFIIKGDKLLNSSNWSVEYENGQDLPLIDNINMISPHIIKIKFSSDFEPESNINVIFSPAEGIQSNLKKITTPKKLIKREGGMYRNLASYPECTTCQQDEHGREYKLSLQEIHEAMLCEDFHIWTVSANCPPNEPCHPGITECSGITDYVFSNDYETESNCTETGTKITTQTCPGTLETCTGFTHTCYSFLDIKPGYEMLAIPPPHDEYCLVDSLEMDELKSDQVAPDITDAHFIKEYKCADSPNCPNYDCTAPTCTNCEKYIKYKLHIEAYDDHCIMDNFMFYIYYTTGGQERTSSFYLLHVIQDPGDFQHIITEYYVDPNLFACANKMKIIAHDKKGNWNCHTMDKLDDNATQFDPTKLPYPVKLTLSFDDRPSNKQYINLASRMSDQKDQEVCTYHLVQNPMYDEDTNHGSLIYVQVNAIPPLGGIYVRLEYIDPPNEYSGNSPTNTWSNPPPNPPTDCLPSINPDQTCEEYNNCTGTIENYYKLWSRHWPYAGDNRTLGDNWNYYRTSASQINQYNVPSCDPIRTHTPNIPCFWSCSTPAGIFCFDQYCAAGEIVDITEISGKFALYFETQKHGGDNFQFRATGFNPYIIGLDVCVDSGSSQTFTVWRKIYLDYAWMEDRNGQYPSCTINTSDEYQGVHEINNANFDKIRGVFDDCFIEIEASRHFPNQPYQLAISPSEFLSYGDATGFRNSQPPTDHVLLLGVDHVLFPPYYDECAGLAGISWPYYWIGFPDYAYYHYCAVGYLWDIKKQSYTIYIDRSYQNNIPSLSQIASAHELGHGLDANSWPMHYTYNYGLMRWFQKSSDPRSYFYEGHILDFRERLPNFDEDLK